MVENIKYSLIGKEDLALKASSTDRTFTVTLPDGSVVTLTKISLDELIAYANVNLNGNQILSLLLEVLTANPSSPATGRVWYISNVIRYGDGTNAVRELIDLSATQTLTNKTLTSPRIGTAILDTNGNELASIVVAASAVNQLDFRNAATGSDVILAVAGDDANIDLDIKSKGSGVVLVNGAPIASFPSGATQGDILYFNGTSWTRTTFVAAQGDVLFYNGTTWTKLAAGTSGDFLQTKGAGANPVWASAALTSAMAAVATSETTTSVTYTDLATVGPSVTLSPGSAQNHLIIVSALTISNDTVNTNSFISPSIAGAAAADIDAVRFKEFTAGQADSRERSTRAASVANGSTHTAKYRTSAGTATFEDRRIVAISGV